MLCSGDVIGKKGALIPNFACDISETYLIDVRIKAALGFNPRSNVDWKADRPSIRMVAVAMLHGNLIKVVEEKKLLELNKKVSAEI